MSSQTGDIGKKRQNKFVEQGIGLSIFLNYLMMCSAVNKNVLCESLNKEIQMNIVNGCIIFLSTVT